VSDSCGWMATDDYPLTAVGALRGAPATPGLQLLALVGKPPFLPLSEPPGLLKGASPTPPLALAAPLPPTLREGHVHHRPPRCPTVGLRGGQ